MGKDVRVRFHEVPTQYDSYHDDESDPGTPEARNSYGSFASPWNQRAQPQSMGGPHELVDGGNDSIFVRYRRRGFFSLKSLCVGILVGLVVATALAVGLTAPWRSNSADAGPSVQVDRPGIAKDKKFCNWSGSESKTNYYHYDNLTDFTFSENVYGVIGLPNYRVSGTINVVQARDQDADIVVGTIFDTTEGNGQRGVHVNKKSTGLAVVTSPFEFVDRNTCVRMTIDIFVKKGIELDTFDLRTGNLGLDIRVGAADEVPEQQISTYAGARFANSSTFSLKVGDARVSHYDSRKTRIDVTTGTVRGEFALRDLLDIHTISGDIDITVAPKSDPAGYNSSATLRTRSNTGDVRVFFPQDGRKIPDRDYRIQAATSSSDIRGLYVMGSAAAFNSYSGTIKVAVLPYWADRFHSVLRSITQTGDVKLSLLSPFKDAGTAIKHLSSTHSTISGDMELVYPPEWEGTIDASTVTGIVQVHGDDLHDEISGEVAKMHMIDGQKDEDESPEREFMTEDEVERAWDSDWEGTHIIVSKGNGTSFLEARTRTADVDLLVGDD